MNELLMQRCVDGELPVEERGHFLHSLGDNASDWKQLACRLLEDRLLESGCSEWLGQVADESEIVTPTLLSRSERRLSGGIAASNGKATHAAHLLPSPSGRGAGSEDESQLKRRRLENRGSRTALASLAACILGIVIGLCIGYQGEPRSSSNGVATTPDDDVPLAEERESDERAPVFDTIRLAVDTPDGRREVDLPVVDSDDLPFLTSMESSITPDMREQLIRQGIELNEAPYIITLPIDDARSVAVPVNAVQMRNVGI